MANTFEDTLEHPGDAGYAERMAHAFVNYQDDTINKYSYQQKLLSSVNLKHKEKLLQSGFGEYFETLISCVETNQKVLNDILNFNLLHGEGQSIPKRLQRRTLRLDNYRINDMLAAIRREWSVNAKSLREQMWSPIMKELSEVIKNQTNTMINPEANEVGEQYG